MVFGGLLLNCMRPMEDRAYDLSLMDWEGEAVTELTPDGYGGFNRLDELGQTF